MTTDKPKWWQSWMVYTLIGLLLTLGPYVGGYLLLGDYMEWLTLGTDYTYGVRVFKYETLAIAFWPLGWIESKIRGIPVQVESPKPENFLVPDPSDVKGIFSH
ncbi:hypothetical protein Pan258_22100 [Symmachiella dynata]|uniref:hypothetical protein n=1 Tax=Symmachiella dynata TaxID=2527995 RepID=UPI00118B5301|nr:hypothetical protein [Symmachiella dynata]QDT48170.1 hypothetical protein Pan258_22100 [Symmachiella dynata]